MNKPDVPKLSPWPFLVIDALLLGTAIFIGYQSSGPLTGTPLLVAGFLIFLGAVLAVIPALLNFTRRQENALAERQREIAALAQTTAANAEQLGIATAALQTFAETAAKSAKHAEQLPQRLQEKINEFKAQLNEVSMNENEALSQEVNTLRAAETERIETLLTTVRKLSSEIARLEAASRKNVTDLSDSLARFTASAEQAASRSSSALAASRADAEQVLASTHLPAITALEKLSGQITAQVERAADLIDQKLAELRNAGSQSGRRAAAQKPSRAAQEENFFISPNTEPSLSGLPVAEAIPSAVPLVQNSEIAGNEWAQVEDSAHDSAHERSSSLNHPNTSGNSDHALSPESDHSPDSAENRVFGLAASADGVTRLVVTAYIGIGNKLFLRGEGPGLNWEKGVPLQFVSIGQWHWETADATSPVRGKLYKNDAQECSDLGELTLLPHQQCQVSATF